ncbi:iron-sulfur cluster assembly scaffold protein [Paraurantiacibacter namhicola]|uniref:NIF system FeS cluster assembly NifU N-terminal domain-containing protein n=1 Tax=Paraurantiacibacter namhicola TaxID=645517 RepID=A0A1C7D928_9SPHN|nr:iron-sulfur cluster assembly scaffold protein [Paraurantiacibacter namhicola]ANU07984.1 hypothetical protein A6F65_01687 [Paraurantiacibacter namhicola]
MSGDSAARLYSTEILALAVSLAGHPYREDAALHGKARSRTCGGTLDLSFDLEDGRIAKPGLRMSACAIGQASAAIFLNAAIGLDTAGLEAGRRAMTDWLAGEGVRPDWPGMAALEPARDYPSRHGAILLPWNAAHDALPSPAPAR